MVSGRIEPGWREPSSRTAERALPPPAPPSPWQIKVAPPATTSSCATISTETRGGTAGDGAWRHKSSRRRLWAGLQLPPAVKLGVAPFPSTTVVELRRWPNQGARVVSPVAGYRRRFSPPRSLMDLPDGGGGAPGISLVVVVFLLLRSSFSPYSGGHLCFLLPCCSQNRTG